jgi:hypothetical protein
MQKGNAPTECLPTKKISLVFPEPSVYSRIHLETERAMELFLAEVVAVLESDTKKTCPSCGERLKLVRTMVNSRTGCIVHMFECPCGQRTWVD